MLEFLLTDFRIMRRSDREKDSEWALTVFDKAPFITVGMVTPDGMPYSVPLSLARKDDDTFYFHCATEGKKLDCLKTNPNVFLSAVTKCAPKFEEKTQNFTKLYNSAMAIGIAEFVEDRTEKIEALRLICERFLPRYMDKFDAAIARSLDRTLVVKIKLTEPPVGKQKA